MEVLVMLGFIGIIFLQILVAIILGAIKLRTFFIHLSIKYMENRKHLAIYLAIHVAVSFVFCCIAFLCYEDPFSRDVGVLIAALSITGICAVLVLTYFSLLFSRKNWIISFVFLICGILSGIVGFKSVEFSVECFSSMLRSMFEFALEEPADNHVVGIEQTKCVGCGKWIEDNKGIAVVYFKSEWEARGYCSAECREKNPNAEAEKMVLCGHCKNPEDRHYTVNIRCGNCGKVFGKSKECPGFHYSYARRCFDCDRADEERWPRTGPVAEVKGKNDE